MSWFKKDPIKRLQAEYEKKLAEALQYQRNGKMPLFAQSTSEAQAILEEINRIKASQGNV